LGQAAEMTDAAPDPPQARSAHQGTVRAGMGNTHDRSSAHSRSQRTPEGRGTTNVPVALSTASVFPERTADAFDLAARLGYDGVEVMVTADPVSQDAEVLRRLADYHDVPVLAVHAPCLVVVHPPFRWQRDYARDFESGLREAQARTEVTFAVENLYPLRAGATEVAAYAPHWNPVELDCDHVTLDLSHTAVSDSDALEMAGDLGRRLAHVHLADGTRPGLPDAHLVPGRGSQPCGELLDRLHGLHYRGVVVVEISTRRALTPQERYIDLEQSLAFARQHLRAATAVG
jgi:sugar phosphate isomerase/epimerase